MFLSLFLGALTFLLRQELSARLDLRSDLVLIISASIFFYGIAIGLLLYLRGSIRLPFLESFLSDADREAISTDRRADSVFVNIQTLQDHIEQLEDRLSTQSRVEKFMSESDRHQIIGELKSSLSTSLVSELEQRYQLDYQRTAHLAQARTAFINNSQRLISEVAALSRRGNLNLVIGVLTTAAAAGLLLYTSVQASHSFNSMTDLLSYYIPRISTVIFIEVFAFFFLRLYKATLGQLQYFQDELTRTAMYEVALESAMRTQDNPILGAVLRRIIKANRTAAPSNLENEQKFELNPAVLKQIVELIRTAQPHSG